MTTELVEEVRRGQVFQGIGNHTGKSKLYTEGDREYSKEKEEKSQVDYLSKPTKKNSLQW